MIMMIMMVMMMMIIMIIIIIMLADIDLHNCQRIDHPIKKSSIEIIQIVDQKSINPPSNVLSIDEAESKLPNRKQAGIDF